MRAAAGRGARGAAAADPPGQRAAVLALALGPPLAISLAHPGSFLAVLQARCRFREQLRRAQRQQRGLRAVAHGRGVLAMRRRMAGLQRVVGPLVVTKDGSAVGACTLHALDMRARVWCGLASSVNDSRGMAGGGLPSREPRRTGG